MSTLDADIEDLLLLNEPRESSTPPISKECLNEYESAVQGALQGLRTVLFVRFLFLKCGTSLGHPNHFSPI